MIKWQRVSKLPAPIRIVVQRVCGRVTGHAAGDRGYGGGLYENVYCRYCNHLYTVPLPHGVTDFDSAEDHYKKQMGIDTKPGSET